mmetsp:Transcript_3057/g.7693  ORF Transcript_3057/g.7693 Transcript_3057/m.7693 type:complete len:210 (-) Transcript_3057:375-1004(-)
MASSPFISTSASAGSSSSAMSSSSIPSPSSMSASSLMSSWSPSSAKFEGLRLTESRRWSVLTLMTLALTRSPTLRDCRGRVRLLGGGGASLISLTWQKQSRLTELSMRMNTPNDSLRLTRPVTVSPSLTSSKVSICCPSFSVAASFSDSSTRSSSTFLTTSLRRSLPTGKSDSTSLGSVGVSLNSPSLMRPVRAWLRATNTPLALDWLM